jgi:radical SAM superfamily enzyme YgiQ (UPF0313 family)
MVMKEVAMASADVSPEWKIALVGRRLTDNENLGLGYLEAALSDAGFGCERFDLNQACDVGWVAEAIARGGFALVGLSIPDGGSAYLPLAFGELLRRRGFAKPITCGGSFATLARHWLLDRYPWLHSVVRFGGEVPLVHLARALRANSDVGDVPGLTTRGGDGLPSPILDETPMVTWPVRRELPEVLGHRAAHIMATRGCAGRCGYCAPAALQMQEQKEGLRAGLQPGVLRDAGVGRVRRRSVDDLCDEMAYLWRERSVRYFYFVDEHMLPYEEEEALVFLDAMKRGLRRRKVGRFGIGTMLRADRLTRRIVQAFAETGLVRAFIGVEFASIADGRRFGRAIAPDHAREILAACESAGVAAVSHLMMIHPYSTKESIGEAIRFLETVPAGVFEATEMQVYHGTTLWHRLQQEGRLSGNPLRYAYTLPDPVVERFAGIFMRLRAEAFWNHSIAYRTHDAFLAHALGQRLRPDLDLGVVPSELNVIRQQVVALYADSYWKALALAEAGAASADATGLVAQARAQSLRLQEQLDALVQDLAYRLHTSPQVFSPSRAAAAGAVAFAFLGGVLPGCHDGRSHGRDASAETRGDADALVEAPAPDGACMPTLASLQQQYREAALQAAPCFNGSISFPPGNTPVVASSPPVLPPPYAPSSRCSDLADAGAELAANQAQWEGQVKSAIAGLEYPCVAPKPPNTIRLDPMISVEGLAGSQANQIWSALSHRAVPPNVGLDDHDIRSIHELRDAPKPFDCCANVAHRILAPGNDHTRCSGWEVDSVVRDARFRLATEAAIPVIAHQATQSSDSRARNGSQTDEYTAASEQARGCGRGQVLMVVHGVFLSPSLR